jgi:hypothetical protein
VVEPSDYGGARVRIWMRLHAFVVAFMTLRMAGATLGAFAGLVSLAQGHALALVAFAFPIFGFLIVTVPFALEARVAERLLREAFAAAPVPNATPLEPGAPS